MAKKKSAAKPAGDMDYPYLILVLLLLGIGLVMVFSSSYATAYKNHRQPIIIRQALFAGIIVYVDNIWSTEFKILSFCLFEYVAYTCFYRRRQLRRKTLD